MKNLGFEILSERTLDLTESIKFGIKFSSGNNNGIPIENFFYKHGNKRVFKVKKIDSGNK